jgi:hypothetical protein
MEHSHRDAAVVDDYEWYCRRHRRHFALEGFALLGVSFGVSLLVFFVGGSPWLRGVLEIRELPDVDRTLRTAGLIGATASVLFYLFYRLKCWRLDREEAD